MFKNLRFTRFQKIRSFLLAGILLWNASSFAQSSQPDLQITKDHTVDSLKLALQKATHDTMRCMVLENLVQVENDKKLQSNYNDQLAEFAEKNLKTAPANSHLHRFYKEALAFTLNARGLFLRNQWKTAQAIECYEKSLQMVMELGNKKGAGPLLSNLGAIFYDQGNFPKALEYYSRSLKIREEVGDTAGTALCLNNIAAVYKDLGDLEKALEYFTKCLQLRENLPDRSSYATALNNIGFIYSRQHNIPKALEYYTKSLNIEKQLGNRANVAASLNNIAGVYKDEGELEKAMEYFSETLIIGREEGDKRVMAFVSSNIADIYLTQKKYAKALDYASKCMELGKELGFPVLIKNASFLLTKIHKATGDHKAALQNYELFIQMRDSIQNERNRKASIRSQLKYEYEKQAAADSVAHAKESEIKSVELSRQAAEIKVKKNQQYALFGGLFLVMVFAGFMYNRFKITQKQKAVIEHQKEIVEEQKKLVEEKQSEILDSIRYARRIQLAQIPSEKRVHLILKRMQGPEVK
jgi:tetratricopeptide (TPR) repeat protein